MAETNDLVARTSGREELEELARSSRRSESDRARAVLWQMDGLPREQVAGPLGTNNMVRSGLLSLVIAGMWTVVAAARAQPWVPRTIDKQGPPSHVSPALRQNDAHQAGDCPRSTPGTVLWRRRIHVHPRESSGLAVANDGTIYLSQRNWPTVVAIDCRAQLRWEHDFARLDPQGMGYPGGLEFRGVPVIDDSDRIYLSVGQDPGGRAPQIILALDRGGAVRWLQRMPRERTGVNSHPVLDADGNVWVAGGHVQGEQLSGRETFSWTYLVAMDRFGGLLSGFPVEVALAPFRVPPVVMPDGRVVFVSDAAKGRIWPTRVPTPQPTFAVTVAPEHAHRAYLPLTKSDVWRELERAETAAPETVTWPPRLHILSSTQSGITVLELDDVLPDLLVPLNYVIVIQSRKPEALLTGWAVNGDSPRELWRHLPRSEPIGGPVLGDLDSLTGRVELVYVDLLGTLVSLDVPGTTWAGGGPTFNWAIDIGAPPLGPPVLGDAGVVYVAHHAGVSAYSRADGRELWATPSLGNSAVHSDMAMGPDGTLYAQVSPDIVAIATESRGLDPDAVWPAARHDSRNTGRAGR